MDSTLAPIWGSLVVFLACPLLGGLPLIDWLTYGITGRQLSRLGTGNISVSAAFYHGGRVAGILAVLSEAAKGIVAILLTRLFFPDNSVWELLALVGLVMGRYWIAKGAGTTNVAWGILIHDVRVFAITLLLGLISFTINRDRTSGKIGVLIILAITVGLFHPYHLEYAIAASVLSSLLWWIYGQIPDDLDLSASGVNVQSSGMFRFFQGNRNVITLDDKGLKSEVVGAKAANLSLVRSLGYSVPDGWVLFPGEESKALVNYLEPSVEQPLVVRSSAIGEDSESASAAGQYLSILGVASKDALQTAILDCQASYMSQTAQQYRQRGQQSAVGMAVLVQKQIKGLYSGVAFSRDPVNSLNDGVAIEALPGNATQVVSGKVTPQRYQVVIPEVSSTGSSDRFSPNTIVILPHTTNSELAEMIIPSHILESVALLARDMEEIFNGIPQDIEWTYDGEVLWLLQVRPITTLQPIWTRKIAAEVIPGQIHPLTWSINRPLTCGAWGELFTLVLGKRSQDLDFEQTATLHYSRAYFNASLVGEIFLRMGLPSESLEFLTRGEKFSKPPLMATLKNIPGLWRLLKREWYLLSDFEQDKRQLFEPLLTKLEHHSASALDAESIIERIDSIQTVLKQATYYSILAPLSLALRQSILQVATTELDYSKTSEIASLEDLAVIATDTRKLIGKEQITMNSCASLFAYLAENPEGRSILSRFNNWLDHYGYLGEVTTDIAQSRWQDSPGDAREIFTRYFFDPIACQQAEKTRMDQPASILSQQVQLRLDLKAEVAEVYNKLLAYLRWSFLALENVWLEAGLLTQSGDIFFLTWPEIVKIADNSGSSAILETSDHQTTITKRRQQWQAEADLTLIPYLLYGYPDSAELLPSLEQRQHSKVYSGIGTSQGTIEGKIKVVSSLQQNSLDISKETILVVPYTDAAWSSMLALAGGLIAEAGGRLSHGAIVAREYGIPAVMDIPYATQVLENGQRVRINGQTGIVEILD